MEIQKNLIPKKIKKIPIHINQILNLIVDRFGKEGDPIFVHKNFIIFLKDENKTPIYLNEFVKIRITKILPKFALAELVKDKKHTREKLKGGEADYQLGNDEASIPETSFINNANNKEVKA